MDLLKNMRLRLDPYLETIFIDAEVISSESKSPIGYPSRRTTFPSIAIPDVKVNTKVWDDLFPNSQDPRVSFASRALLSPLIEERDVIEYDSPGLSFLASEDFNAPRIILSRAEVAYVPPIENLCRRLPDDIFYGEIIRRLPRRDRLMMRTWGRYFRSRLSFIMAPNMERFPDLCYMNIYLGIPDMQNLNTLLPKSKVFCVKLYIGDTYSQGKTLIDFQTGEKVTLPVGRTVNDILRDYTTPFVDGSFFYSRDYNHFPVVQHNRPNGDRLFFLEWNNRLYAHNFSNEVWHFLHAAGALEEGCRDLYSPSKFEYDLGIQGSIRVRRLYNDSVAYPSMVFFGGRVYAISWVADILRVSLDLNVEHLVLPEVQDLASRQMRAGDLFRFARDGEENLFLLRIQTQRLLTVYRVQGSLIEKTYHVNNACFVNSRYLSFKFDTTRFRFPTSANTVLTLADDHNYTVEDHYIVHPYIPILAPQVGVMVARNTHPKGIRSVKDTEVVEAFKI